jgi:hypothetical protein
MNNVEVRPDLPDVVSTQSTPTELDAPPTTLVQALQTSASSIPSNSLTSSVAPSPSQSASLATVVTEESAIQAALDRKLTS